MNEEEAICGGWFNEGNPKKVVCAWFQLSKYSRREESGRDIVVTYCTRRANISSSHSGRKHSSTHGHFFLIVTGREASEINRPR